MFDQACPARLSTFFVGTCFFMLVSEVALTQTKVIVVEHADSLIGTQVDGEEARELIGHVQFTHDQVRVWCDRATQFIRSEKVLLRGNVIVKDDSVTLRAPSGVYYQAERRAEVSEGVVLDDGGMLLAARRGQYFLETKRAFFWDNVVVRDGASTVTADSLVHDRLEKHSVAMGHVEVRDRDDVTITGSHLDHWSAAQSSRMTGQPLLFKSDTTASGEIDTLVVRSRIMESHRSDPRRLIAIDSVEIIRSDLAARASLALFFPEQDSILLRFSPVVWYDETQVTGDSINVRMREGVLDQVFVLGHAFGVSRTDSLGQVRYDQLMGETMRLKFLNRQLRRLDVERRATSLYHVYDDTAANGANRTSGDNIVMHFEQGKVTSISIIGGVEGKYIPENLLKGRESNYHLPGFLWRNDRPRLGDREVKVIKAATAR